MKLLIDTRTCGGAGVCTRLAPGLLRLVPASNGEDEVAEIIPGGSATDEQAWAAAQGCPWNAVVLESDDGEQLHPA